MHILPSVSLYNVQTPTPQYVIVPSCIFHFLNHFRECDELRHCKLSHELTSWRRTQHFYFLHSYMFRTKEITIRSLVQTLKNQCKILLSGRPLKHLTIYYDKTVENAWRWSFSIETCRAERNKSRDKRNSLYSCYWLYTKWLLSHCKH